MPPQLTYKSYMRLVSELLPTHGLVLPSMDTDGDETEAEGADETEAETDASTQPVDLT